MRVRTTWVLASIATLLVGWLTLRMWSPDSIAVWRVGTVLGAFAPLASALWFQYVRTVGDEEHGVFAAWLTRAIGMHWVLVWMLGASDWLRGPPNHAPQWNSDVGAPVVLIAFFPAFLLCFGMITWLLATAHRLRGVVLRPARPEERGTQTPFRDVPYVEDGPPLTKKTAFPLVLGAASSCLLLMAPSLSPFAVQLATTVLLAGSAMRNYRALAPSVGVLATLAGLAVFRDVHSFRTCQSALMLWPWLAVGSTLLFLLPVEAYLRARPATVRR